MSLPRWVVTTATPNRGHTIDLAFDDGRTGCYDLRPLLHRRPYAPLSDLGLFMHTHVECGTVVWGDAIDIAPELLYEGCAAMGDALA